MEMLASVFYIDLLNPFLSPQWDLCLVFLLLLLSNNAQQNVFESVKIYNVVISEFNYLSNFFLLTVLRLENLRFFFQLRLLIVPWHQRSIIQLSRRSYRIPLEGDPEELVQRARPDLASLMEFTTPPGFRESPILSHPRASQPALLGAAARSAIPA